MSGIEKYFGLAGRCAVVTGGARSIGAATVRALASAGAAVAVVDLDLEAAEATAADLRASGAKAVALEADCSDEQSIKDMLERAAAELGGLHILVNNAGIYPYITLEDLSVEDFQQVYDLNVVGTFVAMREGIRHIRDSGSGGSIVNLSSITAFAAGQPGLTAYGSSKAAVTQMTRNAALEFAEWGVTVNAVAPGFVHTDGTNALFEAGMGDVLLQHQVIKRVATPDDIAGVILTLVSPSCSFVTGTTITADGGFGLI